MQKIVMSLTVVVAAAAALSGCGGDDSTTAAPAASRLELDVVTGHQQRTGQPDDQPVVAGGRGAGPERPGRAGEGAGHDLGRAERRRSQAGCASRSARLGKQKAADQVVAAQAKVTSVKFKTQVVVDFFDRHC
ncbi:hypothetical protein GCM10025868_10940 [Angustibacter aerolatus]|uniref:Lipoprotein n=1 Tax=Angustibacter aerolatus TaxID=1162965 RepID=A0ABQ6JDH3_9ACTN|nr:hypothetical protein [Angustibacter aerolatus]GMA85844.1 hypothetical protein GCM10025868_10940 [Angustibacter aerolatus]